jgi:hypothetical protein
MTKRSKDTLSAADRALNAAVKSDLAAISLLLNQAKTESRRKESPTLAPLMNKIIAACSTLNKILQRAEARGIDLPELREEFEHICQGLRLLHYRKESHLAAR